MELRHVRYALALEEHGHFGRAAQSLGIRQPPLSTQIKALETEVGVRLFDRTGHGVVPTAAGRAFLARARAGVEELRLAGADAVAAGDGSTGTLRVGFLSTSLTGLVAEVLASFADRYPNVTVDPRELSSTEQLEALIAGRIDVGLVCGPVPRLMRDALTSTPLVREPLVAAVARHDPAARRSWVRTADLAGRTLIVLPHASEPAAYDAALRICRTAGFEPSRVIEAQGLFSALGLAAAGLGVMLGPASLRHARRDDVAVLELEPDGPPIGFHLVSRRGEREATVRNLRRIAVRPGPSAAPSTSR